MALSRCHFRNYVYIIFWLVRNLGASLFTSCKMLKINDYFLLLFASLRFALLLFICYTWEIYSLINLFHKICMPWEMCSYECPFFEVKLKSIKRLKIEHVCDKCHSIFNSNAVLLHFWIVNIELHMDFDSAAIQWKNRFCCTRLAAHFNYWLCIKLDDKSYSQMDLYEPNSFSHFNGEWNGLARHKLDAPLSLSFNLCKAYN